MAREVAKAGKVRGCRERGFQLQQAILYNGATLLVSAVPAALPVGPTKNGHAYDRFAFLSSSRLLLCLAAGRLCQ